ncbi:hypothetical protein IAR55_001362 [Kwoniella newhampshirensis]|uniref:alpha-L-fucosidase n=1 Tax=Kwoniella newhampshirensis TaxID=1651941 RepID=A0AAW0Z200_9TREE
MVRLHLVTLGRLLVVTSVLSSQTPFDATNEGSNSVTVEIGHLYNSKATSAGGYNDHAGMQDGATIPSQFLPTGLYVDEGISFSLPSDWDTLERDNVRAGSQKVSLDRPAYVHSVHLLASGEDPGGFLKGESVEHLGLAFENGYNTSVSFVLKNWWGIHWTNKANIRTPYRFLQDGTKDYNASHIFHISIPLPFDASNHRLSSIRLPPPGERNCLHVFAISYNAILDVADPEGMEEPSKLKIQAVTAVKDWEMTDTGVKGQIVELSIVNPLPTAQHTNQDAWISHPLTISLSGSSFETVRPAIVYRLLPGDQITASLLIVPISTESTTPFHDAILRIDGESSWAIDQVDVSGQLIRDWTEWTEDTEDLERHRSPAWFSGAKFGIFVHWGLFAVPAWADEGRYAEWYGHWLHEHEGGTFDHHLETYGPDFVYDDFIPQFTASKFNASAWVELFAEAGAKYFVLTTKHHDGFALFDTKETSSRNSVKLGPKRDLLRELMNAAKLEQPKLGRGTYFSMPEWWNPEYAKYGREMFRGGEPHNPFKPEEVSDYIEDIQLEQMRILAKDYETDIMWCDIGLANHSSAFAAGWYADAARQGRHVTMGNRCGIGGDFDTPEMTQFANAQLRKWETCSAMDPHSFGYNANTRAEEYRNATNIIHYIVDITAKGGNLLLNVGPNAEGKIIDAMAQPLLEAGKWLKAHGEAIYDTEPFVILPELITDAIDVRFTRTTEAFYVVSLRPPTSPIFEIPAPLPILPGDRVTLLGAGLGGNSYELQWNSSHFSTSFEISEEIVNITGLGIAWVIAVKYGQGGGLDLPVTHDEL